MARPSAIVATKLTTLTAYALMGTGIERYQATDLVLQSYQFRS